MNRAEIVLTEVSEPGPSSIDYTTYSTEEVQGNGLTNFNRQYTIEPNAQNMILATCNAGAQIANRSWESYQIAINNVDQTGNRPINWGQNTHQDRMMRFFNNRGQDVHSLRLEQYDINDEQKVTEVYPILETLPLTRENKIVNIELNSAAGSQDLLLYKELIKTI